MSKSLPLLSGGNSGIPIYPTKNDFPRLPRNGDKAISSDTGITWEYDKDSSAWEVYSGPPVAINISNPTNGLHLNGPSLSLGLSSKTSTGALSYQDFISFSNNIEIYYSYPVTGNVVENDIVMNITSNFSGQSPLSFKLAVNNGDSYYPAIYGVAKNIVNGIADIWIGKNLVVPGFNFGVFVGVDYYLDGANPGKLTWTPPAVGSGVNPIKIGRALDANNLILDPIGNFVQLKGGLYTSDGSYDEVLSPGANGNVVVADSTQTYGLKYAPAVIATAPFTYTTSTRTLTIATATNSVPGILTAADHTTYSGYATTIALKAPSASPTFTGDINSSTGNILVSTLGKGVQVKTGTNSKIGTAVLVAGTVTVTNTSVTTNSRILVTSQTDGGTPGFLRVSVKTVGTSFIIKSSNATDTSTVAWYIVESIP